MNVLAVEAHPKNPEWRIVTIENRPHPDAKVICFAGKLADELVIGKPLPEGTVKEDPKFEGALPSIRLPRKQGSGPQAAYRNSKEGQAYEQERMDRRTALMQAVAWADIYKTSWFDWQKTADDFYAWLRASSGADVPVRPEVKPKEQGTETTLAYGEGAAAPPNPAPSVPTDLWDQARELGLTPPKAVVMARKAGWDDVRSSTDLSDDQLRELIETRRKELV